MVAESILIVEDNDLMRQGLEALLEEEGFTTLSAPDGLAGLEILKTTPVDLILSDIAMPRMDGYTFFDQVRSRSEWVSIPFIFLTARGGYDDILTGKDSGAEDYLVKPVSRAELVTTLRSRLNRNQQVIQAQLGQAYELSLMLLSNAIEMRDKSEFGHIERVRDLSLILARHLGLPAVQLGYLQFGSILHDIGKVFIDDEILNKPGPLDEAEWAIMRRHPAMGAELVKNISLLAHVIPIVRHHHERWDGQGFPDGLAGEQIPLAARIVAVADALNAMLIERVYRPARPLPDAFAEILAGAGTRYDPQVVAAFQAQINQVRDYIEGKASVETLLSPAAR